MNIFSFILSFFITILPATNFNCDGDVLVATIRNNLNGDFSLVTDIEKVDPGAFVVLDWKGISLMLPFSFQKGAISFTDRKWLWSYQDNAQGLHEESPRFAHLLSNGKIIEYKCILPLSQDS